jgi:hypothetical protein
MIVQINLKNWILIHDETIFLIIMNSPVVMSFDRCCIFNF